MRKRLLHRLNECLGLLGRPTRLISTHLFTGVVSYPYRVNRSRKKPMPAIRKMPALTPHYMERLDKTLNG